MMSIWIAQASAAAAAPDQGWLLDPELVDPAYGQTVARGDIQTAFPAPPPPPDVPDWLKSLFEAIGRFFEWSAPALKPMLWGGAILLVLLILYFTVPAFARWVNALPFLRKTGAGAEADEAGAVEAGAARALLAEADALAAEGRFAEAVHLLLYRSVEDISARRPGLVRRRGGAAIDIEIWALPLASVGGFLAGIPAPLSIGTLRTAEGELVKGFLCESAGLEGATDITAFGGWRAWLDSQRQSA